MYTALSLWLYANARAGLWRRLLKNYRAPVATPRASWWVPAASHRNCYFFFVHHIRYIETKHLSPIIIINIPTIYTYGMNAIIEFVLMAHACAQPSARISAVLSRSRARHRRFYSNIAQPLVYVLYTHEENTI